jgi:molybdate transport system substrate-binding protein
MPRTLRMLAASAGALALAAALTACGGSDDSSSGDTHLTVFAAASLTSTFDQLKTQFEQAHPGVQVDIDYDGSSTLVEQIQGGAPADVFASADEANMQKLGDTAQDPKPFATNVLEIATPPDNPAHITDFADLGKPGAKVVICAAEVPCGAATAQMEQVTNTTIKPVSEEQSVTDVLGKVSSGEADAGVVYVTDVKAAGDSVKGVPIAQADKVVNTYPIATLQGAKQSDLAQQWVQMVLGSQGQQVLKAAGFGAP